MSAVAGNTCAIRRRRRSGYRPEWYGSLSRVERLHEAAFDRIARQPDVLAALFAGRPKCPAMRRPWSWAIAHCSDRRAQRLREGNVEAQEQCLRELDRRLRTAEWAPDDPRYLNLPRRLHAEGVRADVLAREHADEQCRNWLRIVVEQLLVSLGGDPEQYASDPFLELALECIEQAATRAERGGPFRPYALFHRPKAGEAAPRDGNSRSGVIDAPHRDVLLYAWQQDRTLIEIARLWAELTGSWELGARPQRDDEEWPAFHEWAARPAGRRGGLSSRGVSALLARHEDHLEKLGR
jgi:hypothetical protein